MALTTQISTAARNAAVDAVTALLNVGGGGFLDIYNGTQPANPNTAVTTQVKLAHLALSATSFAAASGGVASANAITASAAIASGTATWARATNAAGTAVVDGSVGTAGTNVVVNSTAFVSGANVSISSWTLTEPTAGA